MSKIAKNYQAATDSKSEGRTPKKELDNSINIVYREAMKTWTPKQIREFRNSLGLTQTAFGREIGVTQIYVSYMEGGMRRPGKTLRLLLDCMERELTRKRKEGGKDGNHPKKG